MGRTLIPNDAHVIMNDIIHEACGSSAFAVIGSSSFVSAGEIAHVDIPPVDIPPVDIPPANEFMITVQPHDFYGAVGENAVFKVEATGTGLTYKWQYKKAGTGIWRVSRDDGYDTSTLNVPITKARNGQMYRCIITDENKNSLTSNEVVLQVIT